MLEQFLPFKWDTINDDENTLIVLAWAFHSPSQEVSLIRIYNYYYSYYIELPDINWDNNKIQKIIDNLYLPGGKDAEIDIRFVRKYLIYYYSDKKVPLLHIRSRSQLYFKTTTIVNVGSQKLELKVHERTIPLIRKFLTNRNLEHCSPFQIENGTIVKHNQRWSTVKREYICTYEQISSCELDTGDFSPLVGAFDGEMYSPFRNSLPDSTLHRCPIYLLSWVIERVGRPETRKAWLLCYNCPKEFTEILDNDSSGLVAEVLHFDSEVELIRGWEKLVRETDVDIITSYNGNKWDIPFIDNRLKIKGKEWGNMGRLKASDIIQTRVKLMSWESAAYGLVEQTSLETAGRIGIDLLMLIRRERPNLNKYDLKTVTGLFLNADTDKLDLPATEQFRIYESGDLEEWKLLLRYSLRDSVVLLDLFDKFTVWHSSREMANVSGVGIQELYDNGQQLRTFCRIYDSASQQDFVINTPVIKGGKYEGALVQKPLIGKHDMVIVLDFASLYPSIIIAMNISHDTLVPPGFKINPTLVNEITVGTKKHRFVKKEVREGILPQILHGFLSKRKEIREKMKTVSDPIIKVILDGRQLACKVSANSGYGFMGVNEHGKLMLPEGAASVTAMGRYLISLVAQYLEENYQASIIYGDTDSVMITFPGVTEIEEAMKLGEKVSKEITDHIDKKPINITFENIYYKFLLFGKKTYSAIKVKNGVPAFDKPVHKGIALARRDKSKWVRNVYGKLINEILNRDPKVEELLEIVDEGIRQMLRRQVPLSDMELTKSLGDNYKSKTFPMKIFVELESKRGRPMRPGERISYIIMKENHELVDKRNQGYRMRSLNDPEIGNYHPDTFYYINNTLMSPVQQVLTTYFADLRKKCLPGQLLPCKEYIKAWERFLKLRYKVLQKVVKIAQDKFSHNLDNPDPGPSMVQDYDSDHGQDDTSGTDDGDIYYVE